MSTVLLTKRLEFAAAHRYIKPEWDEAKNRAVFGLCYNPPAHGHNYMIEVTRLGEEFDHKNLNLDMPYFKDQIPTSENLACVLWSKIDGQKDIGKLHAIRLYEDEDLYAEVTAEAGLDVASVTRRYSFMALQDGHQGREWDCFVTVHGKIDPVTGMVADIGALDRMVQEKVVKVFDRQDLRHVFDAESVTGGQLAERIWTSLISGLSSGRLANVRLVQSRDLTFDYAG